MFYHHLNMFYHHLNMYYHHIIWCNNKTYCHRISTTMEEIQWMKDRDFWTEILWVRAMYLQLSPEPSENIHLYLIFLDLSYGVCFLINWI
jgi:hypothetical protein